MRNESKRMGVWEAGGNCDGSNRHDAFLDQHEQSARNQRSIQGRTQEKLVRRGRGQMQESLSVSLNLEKLEVQHSMDGLQMKSIDLEPNMTVNSDSVSNSAESGEQHSPIPQDFVM